MFILLRFLPYILAAVAAAAVIGTAYYKAEHWCNSACRQATTERDAVQLAYDNAVKVAIQRQADAETRYKQAAVDAQSRLIQEIRDSNDRFKAIQTAQLPTVRIPIARGTADSLRDSTAAANHAEPAPAPAADQTSPAPVPTISEQRLAEAWRLAGQAYADAYSHWKACIDFYGQLATFQQ